MPITHATTTAVIGEAQWNEAHDISGLTLSEIGIAQGTATLNFSTGENEATVAVTGQDDITTEAKVKAWIMADDTTADHTANDHRFIGLVLTVTCGNIVAGTGFTIYGMSLYGLEGQYKVRWMWTK
jgi:hypothetical protein